ncbi:MAG: hypothetical protein ACXVYY_01120 [Oryzihumus sp.]
MRAYYRWQWRRALRRKDLRQASLWYDALKTGKRPLRGARPVLGTPLHLYVLPHAVVGTRARWLRRPYVGVREDWRGVRQPTCTVGPLHLFWRRAQ